MDMMSFVSHADLAEYMCDNALEGKTVTAILFYEDAKVLLKELSYFEDTTIENVDLHAAMWSGYYKEFYVSIGEDLGIWVEEAYLKNEDTGFEGYKRFGDEDVIALIDGDVNSSVIKAAGNARCIEFEIDADCYCGCCEECDGYNVDLSDIIEYLLRHLYEE